MEALEIIPGTSPRFLSDSTHSESTYFRPAVADKFPAAPDTVNSPRRPLEGSAPFLFPKNNPQLRYGLLGESPGASFDDELWKDWTLTPLELRHSLAPKEDEYSDFPHPGPLPSVPCVVRFDIVRHFPCETLCMIGCARSDVSNGWVVTHAKTLLVDDDEAARLISAIRYCANEIELTGNEAEESIRLRFNYSYVFKQTMFEHPWFLELQRQFRSTYSLKSTLSEYQAGEVLPRGTLTSNGSWNHHIHGELTEQARFTRRKNRLDNGEGIDEGKDVGREAEQFGSNGRNGDGYRDEISTTKTSSPPSLDETLETLLESPPRTLLFAATPLSSIEDDSHAAACPRNSVQSFDVPSTHFPSPEVPTSLAVDCPHSPPCSLIFATMPLSPLDDEFELRKPPSTHYMTTRNLRPKK
ncbi:hypothetical protein BDN71DRAFT_1594167 [Pleurotus eryngii]|uniref:Uncharacterized protein n=1 Tax=Pleurotus eryngii TaxID=5323 RepID=A0A9P5ZJZ4_PLEER|nr:hypothetical protein BDN71DRAFT_1594167 [Pleurotus eryngii]